MPELYKTVLTGEDSHHWFVLEFFVDPSLPRIESAEALTQLLDAGRDQCHADGVQFWVGSEEWLVPKFEAYGLVVKHKIEIGNVGGALMKLEDQAGTVEL